MLGLKASVPRVGWAAVLQVCAFANPHAQAVAKIKKGKDTLCEVSWF